MTKMFAKVREKRMILGMRSLLFILTVVIVGVGSGCRTVAPEVVARDRGIMAEPAGDYWVGRRVAGERTRLWGVVRRPRQTWEQAQVVVLKTPGEPAS